MLRQAQHERNQLVTVRPELVEGFVQRTPKQLRIDRRSAKFVDDNGRMRVMAEQSVKQGVFATA